MYNSEYFIEEVQQRVSFISFLEQSHLQTNAIDHYESSDFSNQLFQFARFRKYDKLSALIVEYVSHHRDIQTIFAISPLWSDSHIILHELCGALQSGKVKNVRKYSLQVVEVQIGCHRTRFSVFVMQSLGQRVDSDYFCRRCCYEIRSV